MKLIKHVLKSRKVIRSVLDSAGLVTSIQFTHAQGVLISGGPT